MQKNPFIIGTILLIIGLGVGYGIGTRKTPASPTPLITQSNTNGMHMMPDGSMMGSRGQAMSMADMMASMNAELKGKTGDAFDKAFLSEMIVHHEGAVEMAELALTNAAHQEIKDLATAIISAQNKEIADMKAWGEAWYNQ